MPNPVSAFAAVLLAATMAQSDAPQPPPPQEAQDAAPARVMRSRTQVTIRVPQVTAARSYFFELRSGWLERPAERCIEMSRIASAQVSRGDRIDFVLRDGSRLRASLGANCPALGYYSNLYVRQSRDGMMCAGRDVIRSRSGGACPVQAFHRLVPGH